MCFTDGASRGNPGPGGYGAIVVVGDTVRELGGSKDPTTNNEMELQAVVTALESLRAQSSEVTIYTDSQYVVSGATGWIFSWMKNGWQTKAKEAVQNKALWQALWGLQKTLTITWQKIPGHVDLPGNERADVIASAYATGTQPELFAGAVADYGVDIHNVTYDEKKAEERSDKRARSRAKAYSYISLVDGVVETHVTWAECEAHVKGKQECPIQKALDAEEEQAIIKEFSTRNTLDGLGRHLVHSLGTQLGRRFVRRLY
ncbi:MAG: ribonuclease H [Candidatus Paceibacterota bacterium]